MGLPRLVALEKLVRVNNKSALFPAVPVRLRPSETVLDDHLKHSLLFDAELFHDFDIFCFQLSVNLSREVNERSLAWEAHLLL